MRIYPKYEFCAQLYDVTGSNCHLDIGFSSLHSYLSFCYPSYTLRNLLTTDICDLLYYPGISLCGLRKTTKSITQNGWSLGQSLIHTSTEHDARVQINSAATFGFQTYL